MGITNVDMRTYNEFCSLFYSEKLYKFLHNFSIFFNCILMTAYLIYVYTTKMTLIDSFIFAIPIYLLEDIFVFVVEVICFNVHIKKLDKIENYSLGELRDLYEKLSQFNIAISYQYSDISHKQDEIKELIKQKEEDELKKNLDKCIVNTENYDNLNIIIDYCNVLLNENTYKKQAIKILKNIVAIQELVKSDTNNIQFITPQVYLYFKEIMFLLNQNNIDKKQILDIFNEYEIYLSDIIYQIKFSGDLYNQASVSVLLQELRNENNTFNEKYKGGKVDDKE